jgi:hypothetical protein
MIEKEIGYTPPCLTDKEKNALKEDLKHFGYLLPTNDEELEEFEKIYGTTQAMFPEHLKQPDFLFKNKTKSGKLISVQDEKSSKKTSKKVISKKAPIKALPKNSYFRRLVLAAEIASQLHEEPTFGHIKFVKIQYLCEEVCNMQLKSHYEKFAAGPLDYKSMYSIDAEFKKRKWFNVFKTNYGFKYEPLQNLDAYKKYYSNYYSNVSTQINNIIDLLKKEKSDFCEAVATLFAVWKENLSNKNRITESLLIKNFYEWSEAKKRFKKEYIVDAITWMKKHDIVPVSDSK